MGPGDPDAMLGPCHVIESILKKDMHTDIHTVPYIHTYIIHTYMYAYIHTVSYTHNCT